MWNRMGLLVTATEVAREHEEEFNAWYDTEHLAARLAVPGFLNAERWQVVGEGPKYLATYDTAAYDVLQSAAYKAVLGENDTPWARRVMGRFTVFHRFACEQVAPGHAPAPLTGEGLLVNAMTVPPDLEEEFNAWYDQEHIPALLQVPGCLAARRFVTREGEPAFLAIYHLEDPAVQAGAAWKAAADTEWTRKVLAGVTSRRRWVFRRYHA